MFRITVRMTGQSISREYDRPVSVRQVFEDIGWSYDSNSIVKFAGITVRPDDLLSETGALQVAKASASA